MSPDFFPGMHIYIQKVFNDNKPIGRQFTDIFSATINLLELSLQLFTVSTIRVYEDRLTDENSSFKKKTTPINDILRNKFIAPSLGTQTSLAKACIHLIDDTAPAELILMKNKLTEAILMESIGSYITDLTKIFDLLEEAKIDAPLVVDREKNKRPFLSILNDFISFRNDSAHLISIGNVIEDNDSKLKLDIETWRTALLKILDNLKPFLEIEYRVKKIERIYNEKGTKMISILNRIFTNGAFKENEEKIKLEDWYEEQWDEKFELLLTDSNGAKKSIEMFPFIVLNEDKLFFYKKTRNSNYQYFSLVDDRTYSVSSKKRFNRTLYKTNSSGNSQALFWAEVLPQTNPENKIKANIPDQGSTKFIGRKKQINTIREEIIEIPNENGILYGPGGVGKTALLIQLSDQLYNHHDIDTIPYENIIWVSAKRNFYQWEDNSINSNPQQFESLQNILQIILRFFDYEDVDEYTNEELKSSVLELFEENKVLLILDNFETISKTENNKIIIFFGTTVKVHLKFLPTNFKVILTSRELIPSGFKQIKLEGLEEKESKLLMDSIYERYKNSHVPLSPDQYILIHNASYGIPIVIKHCLGQIYEFQVPISEILAKLSEESNEVIKFSFSEILSYLKKDDCYLEIIILLEIMNDVISSRQIAIILKRQINEINKHITLLSNFQCIDKINIGIEEKYRVSNQIGLLAKSLIKENNELTNSIRKKIASNFTIEKRMDYAIEELEIIEIFNSYLETRDFAIAEYFLTGEIIKRPGSHLLNFHYALFLRDRKKDFSKAIKILEMLDVEITKSGKRDANILLALASTYRLLDFPDYENANNCYNALLEISKTDHINLTVAEFFINWSSALKNKREIDPLKEMFRIEKYKRLAEEGIKKFNAIKSELKTHHHYYLIAEGYFYCRETEKAKQNLIKAIDLALEHKELSKIMDYEKFMQRIQKYL